MNKYLTVERRPGSVMALDFPPELDTDAKKLLGTLWREGQQCVAAIVGHMDMPRQRVEAALAEMEAAGRVIVARQPGENPALHMCQLVRPPSWPEKAGRWISSAVRSLTAG
ncbi:MAG: hypothetical protein WDO70_01575 [Alphaproteobacteria bacterium]